MAPQLAADLAKAFSTTTPGPRGSILSDYLTTDELAADLGCSPRQLKRWRAEGTGPPATWLGRRLFYRRDAVREWLLKKELPA